MFAAPFTGRAAEPPEPSALPSAVTEALDALLACERPGGGWMYVCDSSRRIAGFTSFTRRAERIAATVGLANWDLIVLRSPGTPAAGLLLVRAYQRSGQEKYLAAARRAGDLLVNLQLPSGGWFSEMPAYGNKLAGWFRVSMPWATLDDDVTSGAVRCLLALWEVTEEARYRRAAERGLALLLAAQLPDGGWPLTWRPAWLHLLSSSFEDWPSINDAATTGPIHALLAGARVLDRPELAAAAQRGGEWLIAVRGAAPHAGWAQQYNPDGQPGPGRRFEPVALASWESRHALEALQALAHATGDPRFCAPFPETINWLVRSALSPSCWARYYALDSSTPVYIDRQGNAVSHPDEAKRPYRWTGDFGIPAFFAALGLDITEHPATSQSDATWRVPGDAGECPAEPRGQHMPLNPRARISRAASRFADLESGTGADCRSLLSLSVRALVPIETDSPR